MPNTPALVGEGMSGMVGGKHAKKEDLDYIYKLLSTIGKCIVVDDEAQIDIVTAILNDNYKELERLSEHVLDFYGLGELDDAVKN